VSAELLTAALARRMPGVVVGSFEVGPVEMGTNRRASVRLCYAKGSGPSRLFVKLQGSLRNRLALLALGALPCEARLAEADADLPLEHPLHYAGGFDASRLATLVVMEDISLRGGRPNEPSRPLSVETVMSGLEGLARLHAAHWGRASAGQLAFVRPWRLGPVLAPVSLANLAKGLARLRAAGEGCCSGLVATTLARQYRRSALLAASGPQTLLHGDPHPGNSYTLADQATGFYDWQLVRSGNWSHDIGYFLISSLEVSVRRENEEELLGRYLGALGAAGVDPPPFAEAWARYRAAPAFGLGNWLHTYSFGGFQSSETSLHMIERFAAAYGDLATAGSMVAER
jgi:hypothetical protein